MTSLPKNAGKHSLVPRESSHSQEDALTTLQPGSKSFLELAKTAAEYQVCSARIDTLQLWSKQHHHACDQACTSGGRSLLLTKPHEHHQHPFCNSWFSFSEEARYLFCPRLAVRLSDRKRDFLCSGLLIRDVDMVAVTCEWAGLLQ